MIPFNYLSFSLTQWQNIKSIITTSFHNICFLFFTWRVSSPFFSHFTPFTVSAYVTFPLPLSFSNVFPTYLEIISWSTFSIDGVSFAWFIMEIVPSSTPQTTLWTDIAKTKDKKISKLQLKWSRAATNSTAISEHKDWQKKA